MISWQMIPALRIGLTLALGIACSRLTLSTIDLDIVGILIAAIATLLLLWPLPIESRSKYRGWGILLATGAVGLFLGLQSNPSPLSSKGANAKAFIAKLEGAPSKATNWYTVDAKITSFRSDTGWTTNDSRARILLPPARVTEQMKAGAIYLFNAKLNEVSSAGNPHAFNYGAFLKNQGISMQAFAPKVEITNAEDFGVVLLKEGIGEDKLASIRRWISRRIDLALPTPNEAAVAKALLLGDKSDLSEDTRKNYSRTGAIHVLAVSGLHTGIIASIILSILGFISWKKDLYWLKLLVYWSCLFGYVALTNFSPSVQRSAVMFGVLFAGKILRKDTNGFNSLGFSAVILLSFDPQLLFELGFQLSYCAVAGILAFYPTLRSYFATENYWLNKVGELNAVSIAATIGTLPLTTFYFHQFPVYFLLSGILAVPLVGLALPVLLSGLAIDSIFAFFGSSAYWVYIPAYLLIWLCNASLELIATFPNALVSDLWPNSTSTAFAFFTIVMLGAAILRKRKRLYWLALASGFIWSISIAYTNLSKLQTNQIVVYNLRGEAIIDVFESGRVLTSVQSSKEFLSPQSIKIVETHRAAMNATLDTSSLLLQNRPPGAVKFGMFNNKRFAILEEASQLSHDAPSVDFVIVQDPKLIDPAQLSAAFPDATYILNRHIPPWKTDEWKTLIPSVHALKSAGAFILEE